MLSYGHDLQFLSYSNIAIFVALFISIMFMKIFKIYGVIFPKARSLCFIVSLRNIALLGD